MTRGRWRLEHMFGLVVSIAAGAATALIIGNLKAPMSLSVWIYVYTPDAATWAALGAIVGGGVYYAARTLTSN